MHPYGLSHISSDQLNPPHFENRVVPSDGLPYGDGSRAVPRVQRLPLKSKLQRRYEVCVADQLLEFLHSQSLIEEIEVVFILKIAQT